MALAVGVVSAASTVLTGVSDGAGVVVEPPTPAVGVRVLRFTVVVVVVPGVDVLDGVAEGVLVGVDVGVGVLVSFVTVVVLTTVVVVPFGEPVFVTSGVSVSGMSSPGWKNVSIDLSSSLKWKEK
jgi:hypothetical protein